MWLHETRNNMSKNFLVISNGLKHFKFTVRILNAGFLDFLDVQFDKQSLDASFLVDTKYRKADSNLNAEPQPYLYEFVL